MIGTPGIAYAGNFGFLQIIFGYLLGRIVVSLVFIPQYFRGELFTAYQLIDRRFGKNLHRITAGVFLATRAAAEGVRVWAVAIVIHIALGTGDVSSVAIVLLLTLIYTFEGGMAAVIWTDVVQLAIYIGGTIIGFITLLHLVPGGWTAIHATAAAAGKLQVFDFSFTLHKTFTFWAGLIGGMFLNTATHGTDQLMVQRLLVARNQRDSKVALLVSGVVILAQFTLFLLVGAGLWVFYRNPAVAERFTSNDKKGPLHCIAGLWRAAGSVFTGTDNAPGQTEWRHCWYALRTGPQYLHLGLDEHRVDLVCNIRLHHDVRCGLSGKSSGGGKGCRQRPNQHLIYCAS